ncbi:MAG: NAD-dependent epimerase/dehydratase family protein [Parcubacteria group bacterium]|nr:NAD-dependent epimerase/dehydratase family protein [Parcubacteria group bacterium]
MKVLVTGVAGFIGSNLAEKLLKEGYQVVGVDDLSYGVREQIPADVEFHQLDIRLSDIHPLFKGVDAVFHLAAKNSLLDCQNNPLDTADINVKGSVNVFEAAKNAGVKKLVHAETSALYEGIKTMPTPESSVAPESMYAVSKFSSHHFAEVYSRFFGLKITGLRYFNVYGPRQDYRRTIPPVMSAFIIKLLRGSKPVIYGDGSKRRDFIHVDDINNFHLLCMRDPRTDNRVFNLGSGANYSVLEIYEMISDLLGLKIEPEFKPNLSWEAQDNLADITEARKLGWSPKINIKDGLREMVDYIREEVKKGNIA